MSSKIIQFLHPGCEHSYKIEDKWNTGKHQRKFLKQKGVYLKNSKPSKAELVFWAEWEPQSKIIKKFNQSKSGLPRTLFKLYYTFNGINNNNILANTDPFIFGNFIFTVCQKYRKNKRPTCLANKLQPGDIMLFGSNYNKAFHLDLVFVVKEEISVTRKNYKEKLAGKVNQTYIDVTLERIFNNSSNIDCISTLDEINIHLGATYVEPIHSMYSFVPCQIHEAKCKGFPRPVIKINDIISDGLTQSFKVNETKNIDENKKIWDRIRALINKNKLQQGISLNTIEINKGGSLEKT